MNSEHEERRPAIAVRSHPPERLIRSLARGEVAACCCCCCCCLHSLGGLAGAIAGTFYPSEAPAVVGKLPSAKLRDDEIDGPWRPAPARSGAGRIYWMSTLGVSALLCLWVAAMVRETKDWLGASLFLLAIFLPVIQLIGSLVALPIVWSQPDPSSDRAALKRLGRITLSAFVGAAIGMLLMVLLAVIGRSSG
jgi:hypothetical protein